MAAFSSSALSVAAFSSSAFDLDASAVGTPITNDHATTLVPNNYLQCDQTGFRVTRKEGLITQWNKLAVREKSYESKNPQDVIRSVPDLTRGGPKRPEHTDRFVGTDINTVDPDDL